MSAISLYARHAPGYEARVSHTLQQLQGAVDRHPRSAVFTTSLGAEDMVVTDLIARHRLPIAIATLDTGMLHAQTVALLARVEQQYGLVIERAQPVAAQVLKFVSRHGEWAMRDSIDLRKACCQLRKLEPLSRVLRGRTAWVTGLRRAQSGARADVPFVGQDDEGREKLNPLADWLWADVWHYIDQHDVPHNPLHDQFHPSVGCEPCTRAVAVGEDPRAGRWWWEQASTKECGLHVSATSRPHAPAASATSP